jgi:serine/threonine protein kinase
MNWYDATMKKQHVENPSGYYQEDRGGYAMNDPGLRLGHTLLLRKYGCNYRLVEPLGGGLTSRVYIAQRTENTENRENYPERVAAKIARVEQNIEIQERFSSEYETLRALNKVEQSCSDSHLRAHHFFPQVYHFEERYVTSEGDWQVLLLELVDTPRLSTIAAEHQDRRLPEPVALAAASQYAHMLELLHRVELTCADRKLDDIYWAWDTSQQQGNLMVLDWNVVSKGEPEVDLFRFGLLWHELLLGAKPQFNYEQRQLVTLLDQQPKWNELSYGMQHILQKALHPNPERRYHSANALLKEVQAHWTRWLQTATNLFEQAQDVQETDPQSAFMATDLARTFARRDGISLSGLDHLYGQLRGQITSQGEKLLTQAQQDIRGGRYSAALTLLKQAADHTTADPEFAVRAARFQVLAKGCETALNAGHNPNASLRESLVDIVTKLDNLDWSGLVRQIFEDTASHSARLRQELEPLWSEANLHIHMQEARRLEAIGKHRTAADLFLQAGSEWRKLDYRDILLRLIENPNLAYSKSRKLLRTEQDPRILLQTGLERLGNALFDEAEKAFEQALGTALDDPVLIQALEDALTMSRWRRYMDQAHRERYIGIEMLWLGRLLNYPFNGLIRLKQRIHEQQEHPLARKLDPDSQAELERFDQVLGACLAYPQEHYVSLHQNVIAFVRQHCLKYGSLNEMPKQKEDTYISIRWMLAYYLQMFQQNRGDDLQLLIEECADVIAERGQRALEMPQRFPSQVREKRAALLMVKSQARQTRELTAIDDRLAWPDKEIWLRVDDGIDSVTYRADLQDRFRNLIEAFARESN